MLFADLSDAAMLLIPDAVREVVAAIGINDWGSSSGAPTIGLGAPELRRLAELAGALEEWDRAVDASTASPRSAASTSSRCERHWPRSFRSRELQKLLAEAPTGSSQPNTAAAHKGSESPDSLAFIDLRALTTRKDSSRNSSSVSRGQNAVGGREPAQEHGAHRAHVQPAKRS